MEYANLGIEITPFDGDSSANQPGFIELKLNSAQKRQISALYQQLPSVMGTEILANGYMMKLPPGVSSEDLMHYVKYPGGVGNMYLGENKRVKEHIPLYSVNDQAIMMGIFSVMSIASGQYYLSEINNSLTAINQKADKILEFLYGDKKAELMSEVRFVNFAYQNFNSIMTNDIQRTATIVSIQSARKVAMKDIEFYISDLDSLTKNKDISELASFVKDALRIKDCLQLAIQLYSMSNILEVCYSQNVDAAYLKYVEQDIFSFIDKCEKRMLSDFSSVQTRIGNYKSGPLKKVDKSKYAEHIGEIVDLLGSGEELIKRKPIRSILDSYRKTNLYYLNKSGSVYLKTGK